MVLCNIMTISAIKDSQGRSFMQMQGFTLISVFTQETCLILGMP